MRRGLGSPFALSAFRATCVGAVGNLCGCSGQPVWVQCGGVSLSGCAAGGGEIRWVTVDLLEGWSRLASWGGHCSRGDGQWPRGLLAGIKGQGTSGFNRHGALARNLRAYAICCESIASLAIDIERTDSARTAPTSAAKSFAGVRRNKRKSPSAKRQSESRHRRWKVCDMPP